jgi:hypothetical protein
MRALRGTIPRRVSHGDIRGLFPDLVPDVPQEHTRSVTVPLPSSSLTRLSPSQMAKMVEPIWFKKAPMNVSIIDPIMVVVGGMELFTGMNLLVVVRSSRNISS